MIMPFPHRKILFLINAAITGGAERHTATLAKGLISQDFDAVIFAIKRGVERPSGVNLDEPKGSSNLGRRIIALARHINEHGCNLIVAVNQRPLAVAFAARLLAKKKPAIGVIFHTTVLRNRKEELMQHIYTRLFNRVDTAVFISQNQRKYWQGRGLQPPGAVTILNGVDLKHFSPDIVFSQRRATRERLGLAETDFVVGCAAVLRAEKNHRQLIEAIARLRRAGAPARALIVGDGPLRAATEVHARECGVAEHIVMAGMQKDVRPYLAAFDVGVLCSTAIETLSLSALEVMATGVPMVMSDIGGASEIIDGRAGLIYPVADTDRLTAALQSFLPIERRQDAGLAARRLVEAKFDLQIMIEAYASHFRLLLDH